MNKKPKIHTYVLCWNEEKMIPFFIKHYSKFSEKIFVFDNESNDDSLNILKNYDNVVVETFSTNNQIRDDFYINIKNNKWKQSIGIADIVIVCDMDEFVYSEDICESLLSFYNSKSTIVKPIGVEMTSLDFNFDYDGQIYDRIKNGVIDNRFSKLSIFKPNEIEDINYVWGCHESNPTGNVIFYEQSIYLLHFKFINLKYFINRLELYDKRLSNYNLQHGFGIEYTLEKEKQIQRFNEKINNSTQIIL